MNHAPNSKKHCLNVCREQNADFVDWTTMSVDGTVAFSASMRTWIVLDGAPISLRQLSLASNRLSSINLDPLSVCPNLEALVLNANSLVHLDLTPLSNCRRLQKLWLHNNLLRDIELNALSECRHLRSLYLDGNKIDDRTVNLSPLENCIALRSLRLGRNLLSGVLDITPLLSCKSLVTCDVVPSVSLIACFHPTFSEPSSDVLPPAFRRRAATVVWRTVSAKNSVVDRKGSQLGSTNEQNSRQIAVELDNDLNSLKVALLGFRGNAKYGVTKLLEDSREDYAVSVFAPSSAAMLSHGPLKTCHAVLIRGTNTYDMISRVRSLDKTLPIFAVLSAHSERGETSRIRCLGATGVLREPLVASDLFSVKTCALERARTCSAPSEENRLNVETSNFPRDLSRIPISPVTSSESSPPSGVPALSDDIQSTGTCMLQSQIARHGSFGDPFDARFFACLLKSEFSKCSLRQRNGKSFSASSYFEESSLSMVFSRLDGYASKLDFESIAPICGLPLCTSSVMFDAVEAWVKMRKRNLHSNPPHGNHLYSNQGACQIELISYKDFRTFWTRHLRLLDCEERLFFIASVADNFSSSVSIDLLCQIASAFFLRRNTGFKDLMECASDSDGAPMNRLVHQVIRYELKGSVLSRLSRSDLSRSAFCSSMVAAESGIYNGVATFLRTDRLSEIISTFDEIAGRQRIRVMNAVSIHDLTVFNVEQGFLIPRAVEAHFKTMGCSDTISVEEFAPLWLAINDVSSSAASSYFFRLLDVDQDGYLSSLDVLHFYSEKCALLGDAGFVPVDFRHLWQSLSDNITRLPSKTPEAVGLISLPEIESVGERDRVLFWQAVLFVQDELSSVNIRDTLAKGSLSAAKVACSAF